MCIVLPKPYTQSAGSIVVHDESDKKKAIEPGSKVPCLVSQVLLYALFEHYKSLQNGVLLMLSKLICRVIFRFLIE